jgi:hypothetical protein
MNTLATRTLRLGAIGLCLTILLQQAISEPPRVRDESMSAQLPGEPINPVEFARMRVTDTWARYADVLSWGRGQTLAVLDDGCDLTVPEWNTPLPWGEPKVAAGYDAVDEDDDPSLVPPGYHGTGTAYPSSHHSDGRLGIAFNNRVIHIRSCTIVHLPKAPTQGDSSEPVPVRDEEVQSIARALQWVIEHHEQYKITTVNLSPVDDQRHVKPWPTIIDAKLEVLRKLNIWVSAPCANHHYTTGISWPACQPAVFAIGGSKPDADVAHLDRYKNTDILVPATATTSSNAHAVGCAMILREAIEKSGYVWKADGPTLPDAMMAIFKRTGVDIHDPGTGLDFKRLDLLAAVDHVFAAASDR